VIVNPKVLMKIKTAAMIILAGIGLAAGYYVHSSEKEIRLRALVVAQQEKCCAHYQKFVETVSSTTGFVLEDGADLKEEFLLCVVRAPYDLRDYQVSIDPLLERWGVLDSAGSLHLIEQVLHHAQGFGRDFDLLLQLEADHKYLRETFPRSLVIGGRTKGMLSRMGPLDSLERDPCLWVFSPMHHDGIFGHTIVEFYLCSDNCAWGRTVDLGYLGKDH
jgi:hypothetical protein